MTAAADGRVAHLYGLPREEFTPARNLLAAQLRSEGDREGADAVKALRKPTAAAWATNQLVRAEPDLVEALLGAGGELRQAHRQAASGRGSAQLRAAAEAERAAVERLMERAPGVLGRVLGATLGESIRNTLRAASSDDEARELVRSGTLTTELRPVGLGPIPGASAAVPAADPARDAGAQRREAERERLARAAAAAESALQRETEAAMRALQRAEEAYVRAREVADGAAEKAKAARERLRDAQRGLAEARKRRARLDRGR